MTTEELITRIERSECITLTPYQRSFVASVLNLPEFAMFPRARGTGKSFALRFIEKCLNDLSHNPDLDFNSLKYTPLVNPHLSDSRD